MTKLEQKSQQHDADYQVEGGASQKNNACCNCKEGHIMGENVYCNISGRFHPLRDNFICKSFILKTGIVR